MYDISGEIREVLERVWWLIENDGELITARVDVGEYLSLQLGRWTLSKVADSGRISIYVGNQSMLEATYLDAHYYNLKVLSILPELRIRMVLDELARI
jgi:hypothetical protein